MEITTPPPSVDIGRLRSEIDVWLNRYLLVQVGHLDMTAVIRTGMKLLHDNGLVLPGDLAVLFRVLLELQGLGRAVDTEVRVIELLEASTCLEALVRALERDEAGVGFAACFGGGPRLRSARSAASGARADGALGLLACGMHARRSIGFDRRRWP